jgi:hypothetical protein
MKGVEGVYDNECGMCGAHFDLTGDGWMEADSCNICRPCFDDVIAGDLATVRDHAAKNEEDARAWFAAQSFHTPPVEEATIQAGLMVAAPAEERITGPAIFMPSGAVSLPIPASHINGRLFSAGLWMHIPAPVEERVPLALGQRVVFTFAESEHRQRVTLTYQSESPGIWHGRDDHGLVWIAHGLLMQCEFCRGSGTRKSRAKDAVNGRVPCRMCEGRGKR